MPLSDDDHDPFAGMDAFAPPRDPLLEGDADDLPGVAHLRAAAHELEHGAPSSALIELDAARATGVPAELGPWRAIVESIAAVLAGDTERAVRVAGDSWRAHPDVAALPAVLGRAQAARGEHEAAAAALFAALVSDDPDHSLAIHRRRLTMLLAR